MVILNKILYPYNKKLILKFMNYSLIKRKVAVRLLNIIKYGELTCEICKKPLSYGKKKRIGTIDHIIPKSKGGNGDLENLRIAHRRCNGRKGNKI